MTVVKVFVNINSCFRRHLLDDIVEFDQTSQKKGPFGMLSTISNAYRIVVTIATESKNKICIKTRGP